MELIYLDNAATTRTDERVVEAMLPYFTQYYGNASTIYALGEESRKAVTRARDIIAAGIGAKPEEIYFTADQRDRIGKTGGCGYDRGGYL